MRPGPRPALAALLAAALVGAPGCAGQQESAESPLAYTENARAAYETALVAFFDQDWEYATQLFTDLKRKYAYSRYARLAELRLADIDVKQEKLAEAAGKYKAFVSEYPNDPEVPYARYRAARSEFDQSGASALLPPLEERDLATVRDAHRSLRTLLSDFPDSAHGVELAYMLEVVTGLLARHELYVARFYLGRGNFQAAVERCRFALATYPGSGLDAEALVLLGETYLRLHEWDRARNTFQLVLDRHPESAFVVPAGRFLARLREGKS